MFSLLAIAAVCLSAPVSGPVSQGYAPVGQYAGHWGIDYAAGEGTAVRAPASGTVTFAGSVAGMRTVTIEPFSRLKVSVSYLSEVTVTAGTSVSRGAIVGYAGAPHGDPGVHLSTRVEGRYVDPNELLGCRSTEITRALRLVTPAQPYPRGRANRNSRRDIRSDPPSPSPYRGVGVAPIGIGPGAHRSRR